MIYCAAASEQEPKREAALLPLSSARPRLPCFDARARADVVGDRGDVMRILCAALALVLSAAAALAADPVGSYRVEGTNPGGASQYIGRVQVERTGETYRVVWVVGHTRYVGTGIGNKEFLAVSYRSGRDSGLALYSADGGNWKGVWAYAGARKMGAEIWKRR